MMPSKCMNKNYFNNIHFIYLIRSFSKNAIALLAMALQINIISGEVTIALLL
jgi:hypothetical protein